MNPSNLRPLTCMAAGAALALVAVAGQAAAVPMPSASSVQTQAVEAPRDVEQVQYRPGGAYRPRGYYGGPRPNFYGGPRYYGPPRAYYGGPVWGYRPWYRRPYYGTIIGGIALGTIIGATAYGLAPRPPRPDLCWYWADEVQSRGYWDYC